MMCVTHVDLYYVEVILRRNKLGYHLYSIYPILDVLSMSLCLQKMSREAILPQLLMFSFSARMQLDTIYIEEFTITASNGTNSR